MAERRDLDAAPATGSISSPSLHVCMLGLVLLNLLFVALTEAASLEWIAPLTALALASPLLARFKEIFLYRALWNVGVLAVFAVLVSHAMSADLAYVLQDGLILAVLCQVHLLNNLHADQRPDLLFLNSYLIAVITGYITVDLGFAGAFLVYAPFFIVGMQFLALHRPGRAMSRQDVRAVAFDGLRRTGLLLALALLAFVLWPRDFQREALFARYFDFQPRTESYEIDFSETLDLQKRGRAKATGYVALTAQLRAGWPGAVPALWRGATLDEHAADGSWRPAPKRSPSGSAADGDWQRLRGGLALTRGEEQAPTVRLDVVRKGGRTQALFLPRTALAIDLDPIHRAGRLVTGADGTVRYSNPGELRYELTLGPEPAGLDEAEAAFSLGSDEGRRLTHLEPSPHTRTAKDLARRLRERLPEDATAADVSRRFADYLRSRYRYRFPGEEGAAGTLHEFLTTEAGGHCEFFASTLATMLRSVDVPARVVTGYRVHRWNETGTALEVTSLDAHAWVEAHTGSEGWLTLDPTPAADVAASGPGLLSRARAKLAEAWAQVTRFDGESRAAAMAWIRALPDRALAFARRSPLRTSGFAVILVALLVALRDRRRGRTPVEIRDLVSAAKRAGLERAADETPRELLDRAQATDLSPDVRAALEEAVAAHERARYAGSAS